MTPKALALLRCLRKTSSSNPMSAMAIARTLWPEQMADRTAKRRVAFARSAGGFCSRLERQGLLRHYIDDFQSGYYITPAGRAALDAQENKHD